MFWRRGTEKIMFWSSAGPAGLVEPPMPLMFKLRSKPVLGPLAVDDPPNSALPMPTDPPMLRAPPFYEVGANCICGL